MSGPGEPRAAAMKTIFVWLKRWRKRTSTTDRPLGAG
jgi:hypothetical protein